MEQVNPKRLVRILNKFNENELQYIKRTIERHEKNKISITAAGQYNTLEKGQTVAFFDKKHVSHTGVIKKVNQKWVKIFDPKQEEEFHVLPTAITRHIQTQAL